MKELVLLSLAKFLRLGIQFIYGHFEPGMTITYRVKLNKDTNGSKRTKYSFVHSIGIDKVMCAEDCYYSVKALADLRIRKKLSRCFLNGVNPFPFLS